MKIPASLLVGDSVTWDDLATTDRLGNTIDSSAWTLSYVISGASALTITATPKGSGWETIITTSQSTTLGIGDFYWQAYVQETVSPTNKYTLGTGTIRLLPAAGSGVTGKSQVQLDLEAVKLAIRTLVAGGAVAEYSIGGRSMRKMSMSDLLDLEAMLKSELAKIEKAERIANGLGNPSNVFIRFGGGIGRFRGRFWPW